MSNHLQTREDYIQLLESLISPFYRYYSPLSSDINIGDVYITPHYGDKISNIETFSRSLIGLCLLDKHTEEKQSVMSMIKNGIKRESRTFWGDIVEGDQKIVECFPILLYCYRNQELFNRMFSDEEKKDFNNWFLQINLYKVGQNNWQFFVILVNTLLGKLNLKYDPKAIENSFSIIETFYLGDGWYQDGKTKRIDYYISFAFHFYSLLFLLIEPESPRRKTILSRAELFSKTFIYLFSDSGEAVPFGRSLTYKFAQVSFWSIYVNFIQDEQKLSIIKGIINRNFRWWLKQDIFNSEHFLTNGYSFYNPYMLETYNGKGSPYWALKAFFFLYDKNTRFFCTKESPLPTLRKKIFLRHANMIICREYSHPFLYVNNQNAGFNTWHHSKYEKFVYSSIFGFCHGRDGDSIEFQSPDNTICIKIGSTLITRSNPINVHCDTMSQVSDWIPIPGITIRSHIIPYGSKNIRIHCINTKQKLRFFDFSYPVQKKDNEIFITESGIARIITNKHESSITSVFNEGMGYICECKPNVHISHAFVNIPYLSWSLAKGIHIIITISDGKPIDWASKDENPVIETQFITGKIIVNGETIRLPFCPIIYFFQLIMSFLKKRLQYFK